MSKPRAWREASKTKREQAMQALSDLDQELGLLTAYPEHETPEDPVWIGSGDAN